METSAVVPPRDPDRFVDRKNGDFCPHVDLDDPIVVRLPVADLVVPVAIEHPRGPDGFDGGHGHVSRADTLIIAHAPAGSIAGGQSAKSAVRPADATITRSHSTFSRWT